MADPEAKNVEVMDQPLSNQRFTEKIGTGTDAPASEDLIRITSANISQGPIPSGEDDEPPDGGWTAWSQVLSAHIATTLSWGYATGFAVFQLYYTETLGLPAAQVSWVGSVQLFLYFVVGLFSGRAADAGYARPLYLAGTALSCLGMFATSLAGASYWRILLAQGVCNGLGGGLAFVPAIANVGTYFRRRRILAMSVNACGSSTGAIIFAAVVQYLTPRIGFPWAVRVCGFVALFMAIIGNVLLKPRKVPRYRGPLVDWTAFKDAAFCLFSAGSFLIYFSLFTLLIYINSFAKQRIGLSDIESINFLFITQALAVVARPIFGIVADQYLGPINTWSLNSFALSVMAFGWVGVKTRTEMYVYSVVMGFVNGAAQGVFPGTASTLAPDVSKIGTWVGMVLALVGFATLAGPPAMGAIIDASGGDYLWAQVWAGLVIAIGALMCFAVARMVGKRKGNKGENRWFLKA